MTFSLKLGQTFAEEIGGGELHDEGPFGDLTGLIDEEEEDDEQGLHTVYLVWPPWTPYWREVAITIPKTVVYLGDFRGCDRLCQVTFEMPSSVEVVL